MFSPPSGTTRSTLFEIFQRLALKCRRTVSLDRLQGRLFVNRVGTSDRKSKLIVYSDSKLIQKTYNESEREDGLKRQKLERSIAKMQALLKAMGKHEGTDKITNLAVEDNSVEIWKEARLILERDCYVNALKKIASDLEARSCAEEPVFKITGTPGIGKTTFRFWILLQWVKGNNEFLKYFETILFSDGDAHVYEITRKGDNFDISVAVYDGSVFNRNKKGTIGVFEMPEKLPVIDKELDGMELLILTGSPSRFQRGCEILKDSGYSVCLPLWTRTEIANLPVDIFELKATNDAEQQKELDYKFEQFGGVLRFLVKPFATAETLVSEALERVINS